MNNIPIALKKKLSADPYYQVCSRKAVFNDHTCFGRITWEHALMYGGRQIQERFAINPLCEWTHTFNYGQFMDKNKNIRIAMSRATKEDKKKYPLLLWGKPWTILPEAMTTPVKRCSECNEELHKGMDGKDHDPECSQYLKHE